MTTFAASQDRDANRVAIPSYEAFKLSSDWTFAAATTGATGAHTVFDVTGVVALNVLAFCTTDLTGLGTVELGTASSTACLCDQITGTTLDNHETWHDNVLGVGVNVPSHTHVINEDVILTVATDTITAGAVTFILFWRPISDDGNVTVTTPA